MVDGALQWQESALRVGTTWVRLAVEEFCDSFPLAVKSSEMQQGQAIPTLTARVVRPSSKCRLQTKRVTLDRGHDCIVVKEPYALVTPMACCRFLHVDHLLKIELELANVMHLFGDPKVM